MAGTIGERIAILKQKLSISSTRALEKGGLPGEEWLVSNGLLSKWSNEDPATFSTSHVESFLNHYNVNREWWKSGKGEVFLQNGTYVETPMDKNKNGHALKETFYRDLIENNEEYSLLPRAVLKDYKIVPDQIINVIIQSNENEKKAIEKSMTLELESLNRKYELIIEGYENKIKRLETKNQELEKEKEDLLRKIPAQN